MFAKRAKFNLNLLEKSILRTMRDTKTFHNPIQIEVDQVQMQVYPSYSDKAGGYFHFH